LKKETVVGLWDPGVGKTKGVLRKRATVGVNCKKGDRRGTEEEGRPGKILKIK